jgi:restriction endonuclease S subunit
MVPEGWKNLELGSFMTFRNGVNADKEKYGSGYKFVNVMDVFKNDVITKNNIIGRLTLNDKQLAENTLKYGDVLFNRTSETFNEIAMSAIYLDNSIATFGGFVIRGRCGDNEFLDPNYSIYSFQSSSFRHQAIRLGQGAVRANIGQKDLSKIFVLLPPPKEQRKIAKTLSTWDKAISTTEALIDNSKQQKKALMQQLLTGKKRFAGFEGEWEEVRLGDVSHMNSGGTPKSSIDEYYGGDIPWVSIADMTRQGKWLHRTVKHLTNLGIKNSSARLYPSGTVLYAMYASLGECSISTVELASSQAILGIRPKTRVLTFSRYSLKICNT